MRHGHAKPSRRRAGDPREPARVRRAARAVGQPAGAQHRQLDEDEQRAARRSGHPRPGRASSSSTSCTRTSTSPTEIRDALPDRFKPLAGPAAGGLRNLAERAANDILARPRAQQAWEAANRAAQRQLLTMLDGGNATLSTENGVVVLDLKAPAHAARRPRRHRRAPGQRAARRRGTAHDPALEPAQGGADRVEGRARAADRARRPVARPLRDRAPDRARPAAQDRARLRRRADRRGLGRARRRRPRAAPSSSSSLAGTAAAEPVVRHVWTIATPLLHQASVAAIGYGVVMVVGAWLAGPTPPGHRGPPCAGALPARAADRLRGLRRGAGGGALLVGAHAGDAQPRNGRAPRRAPRARLRGAAAQDGAGVPRRGPRSGAARPRGTAAPLGPPGRGGVHAKRLGSDGRRGRAAGAPGRPGASRAAARDRRARRRGVPRREGTRPRRAGARQRRAGPETGQATGSVST